MSKDFGKINLRRRTVLRGGLAVAALQVASPFVGKARAEDAVTLRMHTHVPTVSGSYKNLKWWTEKVEKEAGGKLKIELYGSMQLGGQAPDVYDQVKNGVVDIGWTLPGYKAGLFPATSVFELPFIGAPAHIVSPAVDAFLREYGKEEWGAVHPIVFHSAGVSVLHMKTRKIEKLEDFKGLKIRTPSRISSAALSALGATPVPIPSLKMTEALMHDLVDGVVDALVDRARHPRHRRREIPHRNHPARADPRDDHEQAELREAVARPQEGDRRQFRRMARQGIRQALGARRHARHCPRQEARPSDHQGFGRRNRPAGARRPSRFTRAGSRNATPKASPAPRWSPTPRRWWPNTRLKRRRVDEAPCGRQRYRALAASPGRY